MKDWILVIAFAILTVCVCIQGWEIKSLREEIIAQEKVDSDIIKCITSIVEHTKDGATITFNQSK